ncbi:MAG TPA: hypothetical protein VNZ58_12300 [Thermomicrobiales bacterium]|nr:hypothetical protein [Thermomicrobiales bacterium]
MVDLAVLVERADEIRRLYDEQNRRMGRHSWGAAEYAQGLVADVGDLVKLIMARNGFRDADDIDRRIEHELVDCLWSVLVLARELDVDLEAGFKRGMDDLAQRITGVNQGRGDAAQGDESDRS